MNKYALRQTPLAVAIGCVIASGTLQAATITVTSTADTVNIAECSLRAAIESANTGSIAGGCESGSADADEIVFDQSLVDSTITVGSTLSITNSLTITGPGSDQLTIDSHKYNYDGIFRVDFSSNPHQELIIRGLTLEGGYADDNDDGGSIAMQVPGQGYTAALTLEDVVIVDSYAKYGGAVAFETDYCGGLTIRDSLISGNDADRGGGAIAFASHAGCLLSIENSVLSFNHARDKGGAISVDPPYYDSSVLVSISDNSLLAFNDAGDYGGGLWIDATSGGVNISVRDSQVIGNRAEYAGGGIRIWADEAYAGSGFHLEIDNSLIRGNLLDSIQGGSGAGIFALVNNDGNTAEATISITDSIFSNNNGYGSGGGANFELFDTDVTISGSQFKNNSAQFGAGLVVDYIYQPSSHPPSDGAVTISDSQFVGNTAFSGAGGLFLYGEAEVLIDRTLISDNLAAVAGGGLIGGDELNMRDSEISDNTSLEMFGAVLGGRTSLQVENSTISGNQTMVGFAAVALYSGDSLTARFLTVADNHTGAATGNPPKYFPMSGAGLAMYGYYNCTLDSSLIALNTVPVDGVALFAQDCEVSWSLIDGSTSSIYTDAGNNLVDVNPVIGPLADNGGPTRTHALGATSPAINRGNPAFIAPPDFDQRGPGFPRIFGGLVDIGAFELQGEPVDLIFSDRFEEP